MDISSIVSKPVSFELTHPATHDPVGLTISIVGRDSKEYQQAASLFAVASSDEADLYTTAVCAAIHDWTWHDDGSFGGQQIECTEDNKRKLVEALPWVKRQINEHFAKEADFFGD